MTPNELDLSFLTPDDCAKYHQILFKIATVGAMTDTHTHRQTDASDLIICPMPCYSNGTDKNDCDLSVLLTKLETFMNVVHTILVGLLYKFPYSRSNIIQTTLHS